MSPSIWISCAGPSRRRPLQLVVWRVVEAQHRVSTRKLVDTLEEQALLEEIVDQVKPPAAQGRPLSRHQLSPGHTLSPSSPAPRLPVRAGGRPLDVHGAPKPWKHRWPRSPTTLSCSWTEHRQRCSRRRSTGRRSRWVPKTQRGIDLTVAPFDAHASAISSPTSYAISQELGAAMRAGTGVEVFPLCLRPLSQPGNECGPLRAGLHRTDPALTADLAMPADPRRLRGFRPQHRPRGRCWRFPGPCSRWTADCLDRPFEAS